MDFRFHAFPDKGKGRVDPFLQVLRRETVRQFHFHGGMVGLAAVFRFCRELSKTGALRRKRGLRKTANFLCKHIKSVRKMSRFNVGDFF